MRTWHDKARDIIAQYSLQSYHNANIMPNGKRRKHHISYSIPEIASALVKALNTNNEHEAKRLFEVERQGTWSLI